MNRKHDSGKGPQPPDHKVAKQLTALITARIPAGHGFALLSFPLGPSVDSVIRYIGTGERADVLVAMQHWIDEQRQGWGNADAAKPTQWTTDRPTGPGIYLLKTDDRFMKEPELIRLTPADGQLQLNHWDGLQFEATNDFVNELDPALHIWLGPIPEPWLTKSPFPDPAAIDAKIEAESQSMAEHHVEACEKAVEDYLAAFPAKCRPPIEPGEPIPQSILDLIRDSVRHGFAQGVVAQLSNPIP